MNVCRRVGFSRPNYRKFIRNWTYLIKIKLFDDCRFDNLKYFFDFLKRNYEEKHIVRFWLSFSHEDLSYFLLRDTMLFFNNRFIKENIDELLEKTALNIRAIHHELTKYHRALTSGNNGYYRDV